MTDFSSVADDFFVNLNLQTTMRLPQSRETVLHFFEAVQKEFPEMTSLFQRDDSEYVLEADREDGCYTWAEMHPNRFLAGYFNPPGLDEAYHLHRWLLERSKYYLGVSGLDIDALDLLFGFNLDYMGNRDEIVAAALLRDAPLAGYAADEEFRTIEFEPNLVFALDADCYFQGRISVETRCNSYQVRTGQYDDEPISVYLTVRRYPQPGKLLDMLESHSQQAEFIEDLATRYVLPQILQPISEAIATGQ